MTMICDDDLKERERELDSHKNAMMMSLQFSPQRSGTHDDDDIYFFPRHTTTGKNRQKKVFSLGCAKRGGVAQSGRAFF